MSSRRANPAMCEDADEYDQVVEGSYKYARSSVTSTPSSPVKQQMNTGRKKSSKSRDSVSPNEYTLNDSDSTAQPPSVARRQSKLKEKGVSSKSKGKDVVVESQRRPVPRTVKTTPALSRSSDESSSYYGISQQTVASSRPRAHTTARPQSYYGLPSHARPPLSQSAYYQVPQGPLFPTSYPPPYYGQSNMNASAGGGPPPQDYFSKAPDNLAARFERPENRPQSAIGFRASSYGHDDYEAGSTENTLIRRSSLTRRSGREKEDRERMPPPPRPSTVQPSRILFKPPPPAGTRRLSDRKTVVFDDDDLSGDSDLFQSALRRASVEYGVTALPIRSRRTSIGQHDGYALEPASKGRRTSSYGYEDKIKHAARYQEDVNGGPVPNLTAENLRHVKNGGSSHSTRSSASRDESSYRQSATTRTTRSGSGDDDITIKLPSGAVVEVGNTKINCTKGGEINIGRPGGGSDRGTVFGDDRKSRVDRAERPATRNRASSQSTYSRSPFAPPTYPYPYPGEHAPPMHPQYPTYHYDHNFI